MLRRSKCTACWMLGLALGVGAISYGQTAPNITSFPSDQAVLEGGIVTLTVAATGTLPISYQWYHDGEAIPGATNASYSIPSASVSDAGSYSVSLVNGSGAVPAAGVGVLGAGNNRSAFLRADGTFWGMGYNGDGLLDAGTTSNIWSPTQAAAGMDQILTMGAGSAYLLLRADGSLWTMGNNLYGQLGDGTTTNRTVPVHIADQVEAVAAGIGHSLFVKTDGTLWAMGYNLYGQLGDGTQIDRSTPVQVASDVKEVAAGGWHSYFLKTDGTLWTMGSNSHGQLGDGTQIDRSVPVQVASDVRRLVGGFLTSDSLFIKTDGTFWEWVKIHWEYWAMDPEGIDWYRRWWQAE